MMKVNRDTVYIGSRNIDLTKLTKEQLKRVAKLCPECFEDDKPKSKSSK